LKAHVIRLMLRCLVTSAFRCRLQIVLLTYLLTLLDGLGRRTLLGMLTSFTDCHWDLLDWRAAAHFMTGHERGETDSQLVGWCTCKRAE